MQNRTIIATFILMATTAFSFGQDTKYIDFGKNIQPILQSNCLSCHGPDDAKNDFRVDDKRNLLEYIKPGEADSSSIWTDYLITKDQDQLMPPSDPAHLGGLSKIDLLLIRTWINEGAEGEWNAEVNAKATEVAPAPPATTLAKLWAFQGLFHPAAVHLPVALLSVSALFVFLSFFNRSSFEPVAFHCLWIGATGAVAACVTGWAYCAHEGYGSGFGFDLGKSGVDRHRWAGVFIAMLSVLLIPLSIRVRKTGEFKRRISWLMASVVLIGSVFIAGYQGGELTYGQDHYVKYYHELFLDKRIAEPVSTQR